MKKYIYIFATSMLSMFYQTSKAQPNFVPNYSFEDNAAFCSGSPGNLWDPAVPNWNSIIVNGSTPDLYRPCMNNNMQTPSNGSGIQTPSHGNSYAGLLGTHSYYPFPNGREYIQVQLSAPMAAGIPYRIQYKTSLAEKSNGATSMGMALGTSPFSFPGYTAYQAINPIPAYVPNGAMYNTPQAITDKTNWTLVSFDYTPAVSNIQYLLIGNLNNVTLPLSVPGTGLLGSAGPGAYYYIDEVEVFRIDDHPSDVTDTELHDADLVLSPNPSNEFILLKFPFQTNYQIDLVNSMGQVVMHKKGNNNTNESIPTSQCVNGIYFIRMINADGISIVKKLAITH